MYCMLRSGRVSYWFMQRHRTIGADANTACGSYKAVKLWRKATGDSRDAMTYHSIASLFYLTLVYTQVENVYTAWVPIGNRSFINRPSQHPWMIQNRGSSLLITQTMHVDIDDDYGAIPWFFIATGLGLLHSRTIPQVFPVPSSKKRFYPRKCYAEMYETIGSRMQFNVEYAERLDPVMCATVFGTPGIGKSIFEFYFFNRYISDHPDHIILLSSWKNFRPLRYYLYNENQSRSLREVDKLISGVHLHLCDGAPESDFLDATVCFTSPNFIFFDKMIGKDSRAWEIVMPNWSLDEVFDANDELELGLTEADLLDRFEKYGPVARIVLQTDSENFTRQKVRIENGLNKIHGWKQVAPYFEVSLEQYQGSEDLAHRLFKIEPDDNPRKCRLDFASAYIAEQIRQRLEDINNLDRKQLYDWLGSSALASSFRGFMYEEFCHSCFTKGRSLMRRKIDAANFVDSIPIEQSHVPRFSKIADISLQTLGYLVPVSRSLQSIDSILHQEFVDELGQRRLFYMIFQMTIQESGHPMDADGIIKYLEAVGIYNRVELDPQSVSINFVIPSSLDSCYNSPQTIVGVRSSDVSSIPHDVTGLQGFGSYGIRKKSLERILNMGIHTVTELKSKFQVNEDLFRFEKVRLRRLFADMDAIPRNVDFLLKIPQYVIHCDIE